MGDQPAQRHIVDEADQPDGGQRFGAAGALAHIAGHHHHLGFQIEAPAGIVERDGITGAEELVAAALVHQRIMPETGGQLGDMVHIGAAIGPLIGAGQGRGGVAFVKAGVRHGIVGQRQRHPFQHGGSAIPIIQHRLQRGVHGWRRRAPGQIIRDNDEAAIAAGFQGSKFHGPLLNPFLAARKPRPIGLGAAACRG